MLTTVIETVERLEILLLLRRERPKRFTSRSVAGALGVGAGSAERNLALLCGQGFLAVSIGSDLVYTYTPASTELDTDVGDLAELWNRDRATAIALLPERTARTLDDP